MKAKTKRPPFRRNGDWQTWPFTDWLVVAPDLHWHSLSCRTLRLSFSIFPLEIARNTPNIKQNTMLPALCWTEMQRYTACLNPLPIYQRNSKVFWRNSMYWFTVNQYIPWIWRTDYRKLSLLVSPLPLHFLLVAWFLSLIRPMACRKPLRISSHCVQARKVLARMHRTKNCTILSVPYTELSRISSPKVEI